ncbi:MAG: S8 family serine peptidase, partial [Candidatus Cloacimonetes bacterium]|nr:S8 family serine peptidase [Candidatus Cloacimonadota bacterium]
EEDFDGNGYNNDHWGWNAHFNVGFFTSELAYTPGTLHPNQTLIDFANVRGYVHGTHISNIIAAMGNNQYGLTGIGLDFNVKHFPIDISNTNPDTLWYPEDLIKALRYVLESRDLYNSTSGERGAYFVAVNLALSIQNYHSYSDYVVKRNEISDLINSLGQAGVLTIMAAGNYGSDITSMSILPQDIESEYIILVAATNKNGTLWSL